MYEYNDDCPFRKSAEILSAFKLAISLREQTIEILKQRLWLLSAPDGPLFVVLAHSEELKAFLSEVLCTKAEFLTRVSGDVYRGKFALYPLPIVIRSFLEPKKNTFSATSNKDSRKLPSMISTTVIPSQNLDRSTGIKMLKSHGPWRSRVFNEGSPKFSAGLRSFSSRLKVSGGHLISKTR